MNNEHGRGIDDIAAVDDDDSDGDGDWWLMMIDGGCWWWLLMMVEEWWLMDEDDYAFIVQFQDWNRDRMPFCQLFLRGTDRVGENVRNGPSRNSRIPSLVCVKEQWPVSHDTPQFLAGCTRDERLWAWSEQRVRWRLQMVWAWWQMSVKLASSSASLMCGAGVGACCSHCSSCLVARTEARMAAACAIFAQHHRQTNSLVFVGVSSLCGKLSTSVFCLLFIHTHFGYLLS